jgi:multidrug efflux system membrane fusion protein
MGVRVSFLQKMVETTTEKKEGVVVPNAAVLNEGDESYVILVKKNGRIEIKQVEVAEETSNYSRIVKGVTAGDQVVASYDEELENNQKVSIN